MDTVTPSFREAGAGTGVVCLHSSASSSTQWRPLMDRLAPRFHVLAPDFYGYGQSPAWPDERELSLADEAALIEPILRAAGDRFHLVGHSYGAAVSLRAALAHPERVLSLTLFEPVLFSVLVTEDPEQPGVREINSVRVDTKGAIERGELAVAGQAFVDYWMGKGAFASMPEKRQLGIASGMRKVKAEFPALVGDPTPLTAFAGLDIDTLYLVGERSPASSRGVARLLTGVLPRVRVVEIAGVGHMGPLTHPDKINPEIEAFLVRSA